MSDAEAVDGMAVRMQRGGMWEMYDAMRREIRGKLREWTSPDEGARANYGLYTGKEGEEVN